MRTVLAGVSMHTKPSCYLLVKYAVRLEQNNPATSMASKSQVPNHNNKERRHSMLYREYMTIIYGSAGII